MNHEDIEKKFDDFVDRLISAASQYHVLKELGKIRGEKTEEDVIYENFLMSIISALEVDEEDTVEN
jgi:hypothetical protein